MPDTPTTSTSNTPDDEPILSVEDLQVRFNTETGPVTVVNEVSFDVRESEIVGIVGESGAGKSVTVTSIMRLLIDPGQVVGGRVQYQDETLVDIQGMTDGEPVQSDEMLSESEVGQRVRGNEIAIIFQDPMESLNPVYTVGSQVAEFIELNRDLSGEAARTEAVQMLREVGIPEPEDRYHDYPHEFSGGMRQRVLIAMALGCRPNIIIADEPTTALDVTVQGQILELVRQLRESYDTSFIWVTHDMGVIAELCDRVNVMYLGEIVEAGPVDELFYEPKHPYTETLLNSIPRPDRTVDALDPIAGTMPEPSNPPVGCRFHPRCPHAREACRSGPPAEFVFETPAHRAACIRHDDPGGPTGYHESAPLAPGSASMIDEANLGDGA